MLRAVVVFLLVTLTACREGPGETPRGPVSPQLTTAATPRPEGGTIAVTIAPLASLVSQVAGPRWQVRTMVPPGVSPHVFEPTPADVRSVARSRLVVVVGAGYDAWMSRIWEGSARGVPVLDGARAAGLEPEPPSPDAHGEPDGHEHGERDPHWWLSPELARRALPGIAGALAGVDPGDADGYARRAREVDQRLVRLDEELRALLAPVRGRSFLPAHAAWSHLSSRYGLVSIGALEPAPGREPSPAELRLLIDTSRRAGLRTLFTEPQFPETAARVVAEEAGLKLATLDPIGGVPGREGYEEMMRYNGRVFRAGMAP